MVGKVKKTVFWPFSIDISVVVVLATKHQRAATSVHDIPGEEKSCQLPVFMFCACGRGARQETSSNLFCR